MTKPDRDGLVPPSDPWPDAPWEGDAWRPPPVPDDPPVRPRTRWWLLGLIGAIVLAAGFLLGLRPWPAHRPASGPTPAVGVPALAAPATTSPAPATRTVVFAVTAGSGDVGSVQYTDRDGDIVRRGGIDLPWQVTFHVSGDRHPLVLIAQRKRGGTGPVTCSITVDGKVLSTTTETGRYGAPECSA